MHSSSEGPLQSDRVVVVIPAFNEELTIGSVVLKTRKFAKKVIVVDDGSTDRTSEIASMAGAKVIRLKENRGKSYAVRRGFAELNGSDYTAAVMIDADGQHNPEDIQKVVKPIFEGRADLVIGSRFMGNGHNIPMYRKTGQIVLNGFTNIGAKQKITDTQSGLRALNKRGVMNLDFKSNGYGLESGMIIHFASKGLKIEEVPVDVNYKVPNKHKKNAISMGFGLISYIITVLSLRRPLLFFGIPGLILGVCGLVLGIASLDKLYIFGWSWMFQAFLAGFTLIIGLLLAISGMILNSVTYLIGNDNIRLPDSIDDQKGEADSIEKMTHKGVIDPRDGGLDAHR